LKWVWIGGLFAATLLVLNAPALSQPTEGLRDGQILRGRFEQERYSSTANQPLRSAGAFAIVAVAVRVPPPDQCLIRLIDAIRAAHLDRAAADMPARPLWVCAIQ
jgi:hypothetical protein